jgi:peptidylprolyl isomerase
VVKKFGWVALLAVLAVAGCNPDNPSTPSTGSSTTTTMMSGSTSSPAASTESASPAASSESGSPAAVESGSAVPAASSSSSGQSSNKGGAMITTPSGLKYRDDLVGSGPTPQTGQTVFVQYTGTLTNGTKFDSSYDRKGPDGKPDPLKFKLGTHAVIAGWDEGISTMKKGGKRHLEIPANLAYGDRAVGGVIPANSTLIFDVELVDIQ